MIGESVQFFIDLSVKSIKSGKKKLFDRILIYVAFYTNRNLVSMRRRRKFEKQINTRIEQRNLHYLEKRRATMERIASFLIPKIENGFYGFLLFRKLVEKTTSKLERKPNRSLRIVTTAKNGQFNAAS